MSVTGAVPFVSALAVQIGGMIAQSYANSNIDNMPPAPPEGNDEYQKDELKRRLARDADSIIAVGASIATAPAVVGIIQTNYPRQDGLLTIVLLVLVATPLLVSFAISKCSVAAWDRCSRPFRWSPLTWTIFVVCGVGIVENLLNR